MGIAGRQTFLAIGVAFLVAAVVLQRRSRKSS